MKIVGSVALVTGSNRGVGRHFARQLLERGAAKVYATARRPGRIDIPGVRPLRLDVTEPADIDAAAKAADDVTLVINNAGVAGFQGLLTGDLAVLREEMEVMCWGVLRVARAFAPVLGRNGGGALLNVLSGASWRAHPDGTSYHVAKAAEWALTNSLRLELAAQHTQVSALHFGLADTDMIAHMDVPKSDPADIVRAALDGLEAGRHEIIVGEATRRAKAVLASDPSVIYPQLAA